MPKKVRNMRPELAVSNWPIVLIVDDDADILHTLGLCLSSEGYRILMASNGKEALEMLETERPHVILLDLMMPVMDGWQLVAEMDARGLRDAALVILSADRAVQGQAGSLRASGHLAKPFDLDELLDMIQKLTRGTAAVAMH
jgi:two-component system, chemotaxis family, chemotaxis protein CheY